MNVKAQMSKKGYEQVLSFVIKTQQETYLVPTLPV